MSFALVNPLGWAMFELLTSAQMNQLDQNMTLALDGGAGGIYTPTETLELDGAANTSGTSPTLRVKPTTVGPALEARASFLRNAIRVPSLTLASAGTAEDAVEVFGLDNTTDRGGVGIRVQGGRSGASAGNHAVVATGGTTDGSYDGGVGLYGTGGVPRANASIVSGAGVAGIGGTATLGGVSGGPGVYGMGGGGPGGAAPGGLFDGGNLSCAVYARGYGMANPLPAIAFGAGLAAVGQTVAVYANGSNGYPGGYFQGSSAAAAIVAVPGTHNAIESRGYIALNTAVAEEARNPAANSPQRNRLHAKNLIKAWGIVRNGALIDGYNVASVAVNGSDASLLDVTLAQAMDSTDYGVICSVNHGFAGNSPRFYGAVNPGVTAGAFDARTTTFFQIQQSGNGSTPLDSYEWVSDTSECYFMVLGKQT